MYQCGKFQIADLLIGIEIPAQIPAVEVGGAGTDPVVAQRQLGVDEARLIFKDAYAIA